jgi:hypothetical protein
MRSNQRLEHLRIDLMKKKRREKKEKATRMHFRERETIKIQLNTNNKLFSERAKTTTNQIAR